MAEKEKTETTTAGSTEIESKAAERQARKPKVGDAVVLVTGKRAAFPSRKLAAKIVKVGRYGRVDLETDEEAAAGEGGKARPLHICDSPFDPTGTIADSWHFAE
jgi:hypothetical protein